MRVCRFSITAMLIVIACVGVLLAFGRVFYPTIYSEPEDVGARTGQYPTTPISRAVVRGDEGHVTRLLLRHNSLVHQRDQCGRVPLYWAVAERDPQMVRLLLRFGAVPDTTDDFGWSPLDLAEYYEDEMLITLLKKDAARRDSVESK